MVDTLPNLEAVYEKWSGNNPYSRPGPNKGNHGNRTPLLLTANQMSSKDYGQMMAAGRDNWRKQYRAGNNKAPLRRGKAGRYKGVAGSYKTGSTNLAQFKSSPSVFPVPKLRPFTGRCCSCMPNSKNTFYMERYRNMGFHNLLRLDYADRDKHGWLTRLFCVLLHAWSKNCAFLYPDVTGAVMSSGKLQEAVNKTLYENVGTLDFDCPASASVLEKEHKKAEGRAKRAISRMRAAISCKLIRLVAWFLHKLLGRLLSSIVIDKGQMEMVRAACQRDLPVLFLPTHRSHLDYILVTLILWNYDIKAPHVAAGDNLLIPFYGSLMRGLGGFFIRRKLDKHGKKDHLYRAVLQTYMTELLRRGQHFEFFVEGGRTRSGKALYPKGGLLSVIVDAFNENVIPDAYIVPISISYDRLLDGDFSREQMGEPKKKETLWRALCAFWKVIMSRYGSVRVDFSQPFSLKEYISVSHNFRPPPTNVLCGSDTSMDSPTTPDGVLKINASEGSLYGTDVVVEEQRQLIQGLADHIVHANVRAQAMMSTHLVALLMMTKHRQGVHISVLIEDFDWLRAEVLSRGQDLGFSGKTPDVLSHAMSLFGDRLVKQVPVEEETKSPASKPTEPPAPKSPLGDKETTTTNNNNNNNAVANSFIQPAVTLPGVFELSYYSNVAGSMFAVESALVNALFCVVDKSQWVMPPDKTISISQQRLLERAEILCQHLKYEYIFTPPCTPLEQTLLEAFDQLTVSEILQSREDNEDSEAGYLDQRERDFTRRLEKNLAFGADDDDSDEDGDWEDVDKFYEVNRTDRYCMAKLAFLREVLAPILETYYVAACNLVTMIRQDCPEEDFITRTHKQLKQRVQAGVASYAESVSLDTLKNTIRSFQHNKIINCYQVANVRMISLKRSYQNEDALHRIIETFETYRN